MIDGKVNAKSNKKDGFSNSLDTLIRKCQYDETYGIPTGNLISRLVSELYMCYFDKKIEEHGFRYSRYVDDICFPYSFESEEIEFLSIFRKICKEYNLMINESKTQIENFLFLNKSDKTKIFGYFDNIEKNENVMLHKVRAIDYIKVCSERLAKIEEKKCYKEVELELFNTVATY